MDNKITKEELDSIVENRRIAYLMKQMTPFFDGETLLNFDNIWLADK